MGSYDSYSWHSYVNKEVSILFDSPPFPAGFRAIKGQLYLQHRCTPFTQQRRSRGPNFFHSLPWVPRPTSGSVRLQFHCPFIYENIKWYSNTNTANASTCGSTYVRMRTNIYVRGKKNIYINIHINICNRFAVLKF